MNLSKTGLLKLYPSFQQIVNKCLLRTAHKPNDPSEDLSPPHIPVMVQEIIDGLELKSNGLYLDFTFGAGGHTKKILEFSDNTRVYGVDRDPTAYEIGLELQKKYPDRFFPVLGDY